MHRDENTFGQNNQSHRVFHKLPGLTREVKRTILITSEPP